MAFFELSWSAEGTATVEADDLAEAESILDNALTEFSTMDLETFSVDDTTVDTKDPADDNE